jgi:hypothetical protein
VNLASSGERYPLQGMFTPSFTTRVNSCISFYFGQKTFDQKLLAVKISAKTVLTVQNGNSKDDIFHLIFWPK